MILSYEEVAQTAFQVGQKDLAAKLLEYESQAGVQVPLLLSMEKDKMALDKSIESGDTDLGERDRQTL